MCSGPQAMIRSHDEIAFSDCIKYIELVDCSYAGPLFPWFNKQECGLIAKKLNRVMISETFMITYPTAQAEFKEPSFSDHCVGIVTFGEPLMQKPGPFKFFKFLLKNKDFLKVVKEGGFKMK